MPNPADYSDPRASLIDDLLARQEEVIQQLDELDKRLIATIEKIHPPKIEAVSYTHLTLPTIYSV